MFKSNLKQETIKAIEDSGHTPDQIIFIGSEQSGHRCTWEEFCILADRDYDNGFGGQEVARDLIIIFQDGHKMWRAEYNGSEWWRYSTPVNIPEEVHPINTIFAQDKGSFWCSLAELN